MKRRIFTFLLAAALVLLTACSGRGTEPPVRIGEAIGEASLLRSYSAAEAFQEADAVALVRVGDWLGEQDGGFPITFYKAAVVKSYKGDLPREFTLMQNGGSAGTYEDYPLYTCGNELLVFLRKADADYPDAYQSVGSFSTVLYAADAVDGTRYYLDRFGLMSMREQESPGDPVCIAEPGVRPRPAGYIVGGVPPIHTKHQNNTLPATGRECVILTMIYFTISV